MLSQNHYVYLQTQVDRHAPRRTEWEEIEQFDGPLLPDEPHEHRGLLDRLARGLESLENLTVNFRSRKDVSLRGRESFKTAS